MTVIKKAYPVGVTGPQLVPSFVAFLDTLGTKAVADDPLRAQDRLNRLWRVQQSTIVSEILKGDAGVYEVSAFTDNVVIGVPLSNPTDGEEEYGLALTLTAMYQLQLALEGIFVRGGIASGSLWMNESFVFGSGLNDAYRLESTSARYPRVVVDDYIAKLARAHTAEYYSHPKESPQSAYLLLASDGAAFVNYLAAAEDFSILAPTSGTAPGGPTQMPASDPVIPILERHRQAVIESLFDSRMIPGVNEKFLWAASYHNWYCLRKCPSEKQLFIEPTPLDSQFFELVN